MGHSKLQLSVRALLGLRPRALEFRAKGKSGRTNVGFLTCERYSRHCPKENPDSQGGCAPESCGCTNGNAMNVPPLCSPCASRAPGVGYQEHCREGSRLLSSTDGPSVLRRVCARQARMQGALPGMWNKQDSRSCGCGEGGEKREQTSGGTLPKCVFSK